MIIKLADLLDTIKDEPLYEEENIESHVIYKFKEEKPYTIIKNEDNTWTIKGKEIEKLLMMTKLYEDDSIKRFARKLKGMGVEDELEAAGAARGDTVRILDFEFIFKE